MNKQAFSTEVLTAIEATAAAIVPIVIANGMTTISNSYVSLELLEAYKLGIEHGGASDDEKTDGSVANYAAEATIVVTPEDNSGIVPAVGDAS